MQVGCRSELSEHQVHVWTMRVSVSRDVLARCEKVLSPEEHARAAQIRFEHLREPFIAARGALRHLLGRYLGLEPANIQIGCGANGKPELPQGSELRFNVTHSGALAAIALTRGCDIGIDLEQIRPLRDLEEISTRFFCPEETAQIVSLPAGERERAFFECWTRKEAYVKASGIGLFRPLNSFRVLGRPGEPGNRVLLDCEEDACETWRLHDLALGPDYAAAVAYRGQTRPLSILPITDLAQFADPC